MSAEQTSGTQANLQADPKPERPQDSHGGGSKVKQGIQHMKEKLSAASGPIAMSTGTSGGTATTTGHS
ncbi:hypothetical protein ABBQ38_015153 [Trebouxia sp. C0009 RCD-2024]